MQVAKEGCCKGRPEKAGLRLSIWDNKTLGTQVAQGGSMNDLIVHLRVNGMGLYPVIHRVPRSTVSLVSTYCVSPDVEHASVFLRGWRTIRVYTGSFSPWNKDKMDGRGS
jgi:hypothetical protein